jgi:hypothetical protein
MTGRVHFTILIAVFFWWASSSCNNVVALEKDEIAKISYESYGCFGGTKSTITFIRRDGVTFAKIQAAGNNDVTRVTQVQAEKLDSVIAAVRRLKKGSGCTSSIKYEIQTKSEAFVRQDEGCQDTGFSDLLSEIFEKHN